MPKNNTNNDDDLGCHKSNHTKLQSKRHKDFIDQDYCSYSKPISSFPMFVVKPNQRNFITDYLLGLYEENPTLFNNLNIDKVNLILFDLFNHIKNLSSLDDNIIDFHSQQKTFFSKLIIAIPSILDDSIITKNSIARDYFGMADCNVRLSTYLKLLDIRGKFLSRGKAIGYLNKDSEVAFRHKANDYICYLLDNLGIDNDNLHIYKIKADDLLNLFFQTHTNRIIYKANPYVLGASIVYLVPQQIEGKVLITIPQILKVKKNYKITKESILIFINKWFCNIEIDKVFRIKEQLRNNLIILIFRFVISHNLEYDNINNDFNLDLIKDYIICKTTFVNKTNLFMTYINKYIEDLTVLILYLKKLNDRNVDEYISFSDISEDILSGNIYNFNVINKFAKYSLQLDLISSIVNVLRDNFPDNFSLRYKSQQNGLDENELDAIRKQKNKFWAINQTYTFFGNDIYFEKSFNGVCEHPDCNISFIYLPALEMHHDTLSKNNPLYLSFSTIMRRRRESIPKLIESQMGGFSLLCRNHHRSEKVSSFYDYLDLFNLNSFYYDINGKLFSIHDFQSIYDNRYNFLVDQYSYEITNKILYYMKKRYIYEFIFGRNYICPCCKNVSFIDQMYMFDAHHTDSFIKTVNIKDFIEDTHSIKDILLKFIDEECVYICGNCHAMINSIHFPNHYNKIIGRSFKEQVDLIYSRIHNGINIQRDTVLKLKSSLNTISLDEFI